jgi:hypothetical protein
MTLRGSGDDGKRKAGTKSKFVLSTIEKNFILWDTTPCSPLEINRVSEEHVAPIFRVEEKIKQETSKKQVESRAQILQLERYL